MPSFCFCFAMFRLDPDTFKKVHPAEYHRRFLANGVRPDGRSSLGSFRTAHVLSGAVTTAHGSALARLGSTTALCGVKAEVAVPNAQTPAHGFVVANVDFPALCNPAFRAGAPAEFAQSVSEAVADVARRCVDLESLCIEPDRAVWVLHADIVFLNYEGGAIDAALLALLAALKNTRLPTKTVYSKTDGVVRASAGKTVSLALTRFPVSSTFGVVEAAAQFDGGVGSKGVGVVVMADPTEEEDAVVASKVTVVVDSGSGELMGTFGGAMGVNVLEDCIDSAQTRAKEVYSVIEAAEKAAEKAKIN
ncbi:exosome complex exonuclease RRP43-like protein [Chytriomyces sp. MP71]|nr:exosome complex exonuclease RRP43-like protein [Chytriomyces sp. MP71]